MDIMSFSMAFYPYPGRITCDPALVQVMQPEDLQGTMCLGGIHVQYSVY